MEYFSKDKIRGSSRSDLSEREKKKEDKMSDLTVALITIFGTVVSVSGVVLYVFNGTRKMIGEIRKTMDGIKELMKEMIKINQQQHSDVIELLKKGFGAQIQTPV